MYRHTHSGRTVVITSVVVVLAMLVPVASTAAQGKADLPEAALAKPDSPVTEFVHPEALTSPQWLAAHLSDPSIRIVDSRFPPNQAFYEAAHIPGAVYFDFFSIVPIPAPEVFEQLMGQLGIGNGTTVVVYDAQGGWAARLWWALRYYGHDEVKILDGGLLGWMLAGLPLESGTVTPAPATFAAHARPELIATVDDVKAAIRDPKVRIVDALPEEYYTGLVSMSPYLRAGHIPTACNLPIGLLIDFDGGLYPPSVLADRAQRVVFKPDRQIITYCGGGVAGAFELFVLYLLGYENVKLYDRSWMEWGADPTLPVETRPERCEAH
jgi:thiosulfate/3-mercaptopyruvate sulfurtransferase